MATFEELDALSSSELHHRAVSHAERHAHLGFLYDLARSLPAATAAAGEVAQADVEIGSLINVIREAHTGSDPAVQDELRPLYIEYLEQHPDA